MAGEISMLSLSFTKMYTNKVGAHELCLRHISPEYTKHSDASGRTDDAKEPNNAKHAATRCRTHFIITYMPRLALHLHLAGDSIVF